MRLIRPNVNVVDEDHDKHPLSGAHPVGLGKQLGGKKKSVRLGSIKLLLLSRKAPWNNPKEEWKKNRLRFKKNSVFRLEEAEDSLKA